MSSLSRRAERLLAAAPLSPYFAAHRACSGDAWDPVDNPAGYIGLCVAESMLMWDRLGPALRAPRAVDATDVAYDKMTGSDGLRAQLARFLGRRLVGRPVRPEHLVVLNGAGSVLEMLFYLLCDPGDGVLVPTPSYPGFWDDLELRDQAVIVPVPRHFDDGFALSTDQLDAALATAGRPVKALLYTNPDNPTGRVASPAETRAVRAWAADRDLHLVLDEVYGLSVFGSPPFASGASLAPRLGERVHLVWSFSKDLAMSGVRAGVLLTEHPGLLAALDELGYWGTTSGDTQALLRRLLADEAWMDAFLDEHRRRLAAAHGRTTRALRAQRLPHLPGAAGFFVVLDLRHLLEEPTWAAEHRLWQRLLDETNVNLTPGSACRAPGPGFMRLVFTCAAPEAVDEGIRRVGRWARTRGGAGQRAAGPVPPV